MAKRVKKTTTIKKKSWVKVQAPASFNKAEIGETYVEDINTLVGKRFKVNAMTLLNDPKKRKYNFSFVVKSVDNGIPVTRPVAFEIQPASIKILIRKKRDRIDHRFKITLGDGSLVIIKPIIITRSNTTHSVHTALRKLIEELIKKKAENATLDDFFISVASGKLGKDIKSALGKLYPVNILDIRVLEVVTFGDASVKKKRSLKKDVMPSVEEQVDSETPKEEVKVEA